MLGDFYEEMKRVSQETDEFAIKYDDKYFGIRFYSGDTCCAGWDYYYMDKDFNNLHDGVLDFPDDDPDYPLEDAVRYLFEDLKIEPITYEFIDTDWYFDKVM